MSEIPNDANMDNATPDPETIEQPIVENEMGQEPNSAVPDQDCGEAPEQEQQPCPEGGSEEAAAENATPAPEAVAQPIPEKEIVQEQTSPVTCWNCGAVLEKDQLFCPKCGSKADAPLEKNKSIQEFNEKAEKKKKAKKKRLIVIVSVLLVLLLGGGAASYFFYFEPNSRYTEAVALYNEGEYEAAAQMFEELGDFKDSADRVVQCETAIKQEKYDEAMRKAKNYQYGEAIKLLTELGDFSDSKAKITELENEYFGLLQQIYAYVARGYDTDVLLADCVYNTLLLSDLYDAYDSSAMSHLYGGSSYLTYYYWSRYYNGYVYVVEADTARAFVQLLNLTNENITEIDRLLVRAADPPEKYKTLYGQIQSMYSTYKTFHNFVNKRPSLSYTTYESYSKSYKNSAKSAMDTVKRADSKIANKVSTYAWSK